MLLAAHNAMPIGLLPGEFCAAVRDWLDAGEPAAAPELQATQHLLGRFDPAGTPEAFERQLTRLAGHEVPLASPADARAAEVLLDLWRGVRSGTLFADR